MYDEEKEKRKVDAIWALLMGLSIGMMLLSIIGCAETKYVPVPTKTSIVEKETMVPMPIPQDSATIRAWLECDERGRVVMKWLDTERSHRIRLQVSLDSMGVLMGKMKTKADTVYLPSKEIVRTDSICVPFPVEKKLSKWEEAWMLIGKVAASVLMAVIIYLAMKIVMFYHKKIESRK